MDKDLKPTPDVVKSPVPPSAQPEEEETNAGYAAALDQPETQERQPHDESLAAAAGLKERDLDKNRWPAQDERQLKYDQEQLRLENARLREELGQAQENILGLESRLEVLDDSLRETQHEVARLEEIIRGGRALLRDLLTSSLAIARESRLRIEAWLESCNPSELDTLLSFFQIDDKYAVLKELEANVPQFSRRDELSERIDDAYEWLRIYFSKYLTHFGAPIDIVFQFHLKRFDPTLFGNISQRVRRGKISGVKRLSEIIKGEEEYLDIRDELAQPSISSFRRRILMRQYKRASRSQLKGSMDTP